MPFVAVYYIVPMCHVGKVHMYSTVIHMQLVAQRRYLLAQVLAYVQSLIVPSTKTSTKTISWSGGIYIVYIYVCILHVAYIKYASMYCLSG